MKEIKIYENEQFGQVRTAVNEGGEPMFCLADVCNALGLANPAMVKNRLREDDLNTAEAIDSLGRKQQATFINEGNLYKCVFQSRAEKAEQFQDWVCTEVLPSIRKHGMYATEVTMERMIEDPDFAIGLLNSLKKGVRSGSDGTLHTTITPKVTPRGQQYFLNKILHNIES